MPRKINFDDMSVNDVRKMKKDVRDFLAHLEDEHRNAGISDEAYKDAKEKNERKLQEIQDIMKKWGVDDDASAPGTEAKPSTAASSPSGATSSPAPAVAITPAKPVQASEPISITPAAAVPAVSQAQAEAAITAAVSAQIAAQAEIMQTKMAAEVDKLKAYIDAVKETGASHDERMQKTTESIGELRSMVFQREGAAREMEMKFERMADEISAIKPEKIAKELEKRDKKSAEQDMILEKLDRKSADTQKIVTGIRETLESIGGLENIAAVNRSVAERMAKMNRTEGDIQKLSSKTEKMYIDINKKLEEFTLYKTKQDSMEDLLEDLMKSVDTISVNLEGFASKKDFEKFREEVLALQESLERIRIALETVIPLVQLKIPDTIKTLREEKEGIETLLSSISQEVKHGRMKKAEYENVKEKNMSRLAEIDGKLKEEWNNFLKVLKIKAPAPGAKPGAAAPEAAPEKQEATTPEAESEEQEVAGGAGPEPGEGGAEGREKGTEKPAEEETQKPEENVEPEPAAEAEKKPVKLQEEGQPTKSGGGELGPGKGVSQPMKEKKGKPKKQATVEAAEVPEKEGLLEELGDSFKKGLLSKEAYERTRKVLEGYEK